MGVLAATAHVPPSVIVTIDPTAAATVAGEPQPAPVNAGPSVKAGVAGIEKEGWNETLIAWPEAPLSAPPALVVNPIDQVATAAAVCGAPTIATAVMAPAVITTFAGDPGPSPVVETRKVEPVYVPAAGFATPEIESVDATFPARLHPAGRVTVTTAAATTPATGAQPL